jgi:membrane fusion protein, multidrug efflux system
MMLLRCKNLLVVLVLGALFGGVAWWWWVTSGYVSIDDARIKADVVAISAELTAKITSLTKREGDRVSRNEVLATLDRRELAIQIKQAQAELDRLSSKAQQEAHSIELYQATQREEVAKAEASLRAVRYSSDDVRAHALQAKQDWNRNRQLFQKQLVAEQDLNRAATELRQSEACLHCRKKSKKASRCSVSRGLNPARSPSCRLSYERAGRRHGVPGRSSRNCGVSCS